MITRSSGQHVFIALGTPWLDAVVAFLEPRARVDPWIMRGKMAIGDLLITVLDHSSHAALHRDRGCALRRHVADGSR
ncbi:hypothetical protein [Rhodococcus erythropolis]|uniref:Uncharacterized protein n=1 Tax=Rhodococcus erythropolis TaxID=1833 RepID=A0AAX3ZYW2_RHOER|nr:hypothetical protein [Rhodococcus erythropolis]WMN01781.1 hypothetical protein QIE55_31275 [Rhodococcus erythropolis]